jgi:UDP-N-acetylglucosamine 1-carboxyvinyltransferase
MDKLIIEGGARLQGEVRVDGAKNAALPAMAASLLTDEPVYLRNVPAVVDIRTMGRLLDHLGVSVSGSRENLALQASALRCCEAPYDLVRTMRASILVLGPLIGREGYAKVSFPGGCAIGARPVNLHLMGLEAMGVALELRGGYIEGRAKRLRGARIYLDIPSVTGTENLMMAAALARGETTIENAAREPEVVDLALMLNKMGANISGAGTPRIVVQGTQRLKGVEHEIIGDRIVAGTFAAASAITRGDVLIRGAPAAHLESVLQKMTQAGACVEASAEGIRVSASERLKSVDIQTSPYPGFPTDLQAQFMAMMCVAGGVSTIRETVFENRFMHVAELRRMGADILVEGPTAIVRGVDHLEGAPVMATDLRASASLVLAGLAARGTTVVSRVYHLDRGYASLESKLGSLGARIRRERG